MFAVAVAARTVAGLAAAGGSALAAFPGANGTIVFDIAVSHRPQIFTSRPDGTGLRQFMHGSK
jgi:hypothetical protein